MAPKSKAGWERYSKRVSAGLVGQKRIAKARRQGAPGVEMERAVRLYRDFPVLVLDLFAQRARIDQSFNAHMSTPLP